MITVQYKELNLPVKIQIRKNMKKMTVNIKNSEMIIRHNGYRSNEEVQEIINGILEENYEQILELIKKDTINHETRIWGEKYDIKTGNNFIDHSNKIIYISNTESEKLLNQLYREELMKEINRTKNKYQNMLNIEPTEWKVRKVSKYWGQITKNKRTNKCYITINLNIIKKPKECLKQTMIHELCHFYEWNHGPKFKALMTQYCPDWREIKERNNL